MNKIQQYRKVSAKKIGLKLEDHELLGKVYRNYKTQFIVPIDAWQPDTNHNQMAMVLDLVLKSGWQVYLFAEDNGEYWVRFKTINKDSIEAFADLLPIAFMKAFLAYVESIK